MKVRISTLKNGLRIATDALPSVETVSLGIWVGAGSRCETKDNNGVAHFLEHMAFKGTKKRNALQIAEEIENVGGYLNAYTSREVTAYYAKILKGDVPLALDILSDILQNSTFDLEEMEREREVIIQEIGQSKDTPDDIIFDHFQEAAYPDQPMGRPILGPASLIKKMPREMLMTFMETLYTPDNMVLVASGNVDHEEIVKQAEECLSAIPEKKQPKPEASVFKGGEYRENRKLEQLHALLGFEGNASTCKDYYTATLYSTVLGGGMSSRLFQEIREKRGLVYTIYSFMNANSDTGLFGIYAGTGEQGSKTLMDVTFAELEKMTHTVKEEELHRAKAQVKASLLMGLESTNNRARRIAHNILTHGRVIDIEEIVQKIESVNVTQIQKYGTHLIQKPKVFAALGPIGSLPSV
jgi:predicted Zn-dependent peptidase